MPAFLEVYQSSLGGLASIQTGHNQSHYGHSQSELVTSWAQRSWIIFVACYIKYLPPKRPAKPATKRGRPPTGSAVTAAQRMRHLRARERRVYHRAERAGCTPQTVLTVPGVLARSAEADVFLSFRSIALSRLIGLTGR